MIVRDLTDQRFDRLLVTERVANTTYGQARWLCICDCGEWTTVNGQALVRGATRSCGCLNRECRKARSRPQKRGSASPHWKGGRHVRKDSGYVMLTNAEYPGATFPNRTLEHVAVMARHLGRSLMPGEVVHHKNGIRGDNDLNNLELWTKHQPPGQRVADLIVWAKQLLTRYADGLVSK